MINIENNNTYKEALYSVKRGFLIIGLTGYTGSGCSTARKILENKNQDNRIPIPHYIDLEGLTSLSQGEYAKLKRVWNEIPWNPFISIEVSHIIFAFALHEALSKRRSESNCLLMEIRSLAENRVKQLEGLSLLKINRSLDENEAEKIITSVESIKEIYEKFKNDNISDFIEIMQEFGDQIRKYGEIFPSCNNPIHQEHVQTLPQAIKNVMKAYRRKEKERFCIDAFRNPYEVEYFRRRYSEFYLVHIARNCEDRKNSLSCFKLDFEKLEKRERGKHVEHRKENVHEWFPSQNIDECAQKSDYFINNVQGKKECLQYQLIRLLVLAHQPGCVPPTEDERSMQIAMTARHMSGCISRQVGAVVVGPSGFVVGVGWNDPPKGQVPCSLRTGADLVHSPTTEVFSDYERSEKFVDHVKQNCRDRTFCFKDEYAALKGEKKKVEYARSLHAEENAFLQAADHSGGILRESTLYSTTITCMLCAKKAYHLGVKRIVYIDAYPDIAIEQVIQAGKQKITISPFEGATGSAYFRLFSPIAPEKDMITLYSQPIHRTSGTP